MKPECCIAASVLWLAACDAGASAVPARDHAAASPVLEQTVSIPADPRADALALKDGAPIWSANARYTGEENAQYHFERDGQVFGAKSLEDFVGKAHAFVTAPPAGAQTLTRDNGDRLIYDPASNTFAVATKDGAPRTMFKPDDGAAYWEKQKQIEAGDG
ncbi:MAG TPA: hypothetical protein VF122_05250 [Caulobacteraceae bacterium]